MGKSKNKFIHFLCLLICFSTCCAFISDKRVCVINRAKSELYVREKTGHNDGIEVEAYLAHVGLTKGNPWCAAVISYDYSHCSIDNPKSGYCPNWFTQKHLVYKRDLPGKNDFAKVKIADVFGIYFPSMHRIAHVGIILKRENSIVVTIEGNTNGAGSRDGDGRYCKRRNINQIYAVASYIQ